MKTRTHVNLRVGSRPRIRNIEIMRPAALSCFCKPLAQVCIFSLLACSAAGMEGGPPASQKCTGMDKCDDPLVFKCDIGASRSGFRALKSVLTEEGINDDTTQHALSSVVRAMRGKADDVSVGDVHSLGSLMAVPSEVRTLHQCSLLSRTRRRFGQRCQGQ